MKELRPVITGENKHWSYQLIQQEVMEKKKGLSGDRAMRG